jgi:cell division protein FtsN
VSSSRQRISARDYKHGGGKRGGFDIAQYQQFGVGLAAGLLVALGIFVFDRREKPAEAEVATTPKADKQAAAKKSPAAEADDAAEQYDFYDMLPKYEVVIPEQDRDVRRDQPSVAVVQAGAYVLQVGSFQNQPEAERLRDKLAKQGIDATIQRIAIDADVRHRVRVGPIRDLAKLNATRRQLRAADIDALLIRLGD